MESGINHLGCTARFLDLKSIENLCCVLASEFCDRMRTFDYLEDLREAFKQAWEKIPDELLFNLSSSMTKRCFEVIVERGGKTPY